MTTKQEKTKQETNNKKTTNKKTSTKTTRGKTKELTAHEKLLQVIKEVEETKNTVTIEDTEYVKVHERRKILRKIFGFDLKIHNIMREFTTSYVVFETQVFVFDTRTNNWEFVANGHASEHKAASDFNKHNFLENCETSAVGRALENLGVGNDQMSDAEAIKNRVKSKSPVSETTGKTKKYITPTQVKELEDLIKENFDSLQKGINTILKERTATKLQELTIDDYNELKTLLNDEEDTVL